MTADEPIRLPLLQSSPIKTGSKIKLRYTFEDVQHPIYGNGSNLVGELPFLLPKGSYPVPRYLTLSRREQDALLNSGVNRLRHMHQHLTEDELRTKLLGTLIFSTFLHPHLHAGTLFYDIAFDHFVSMFRGDDYLDDEDGFPVELTTQMIYKRRDLWEKAYRGEYEAINGVSQTFPIMEPALTVVLKSLKTIEEQIPNVRENLTALFDSIMVTTQGVILKYGAGSDTFSEEGRKVIRAYEGGMVMITEFGAVLRNIRFPAYVRQSILFRMLIDGVWYFSALINDVLGLNKDIKNSDTASNVILRKVVNNKISLNQAFEEEVRRLQDITLDIGVAARKLIESFPEHAGVSDFATHCLEYCDGQTYCYMLLAHLKIRYGSVGTQVVPA